MDWKTLLTSLAFGALTCPVLAQNQTLPRLHDMDPKGRQPFLVQGCHADVCSHEGGPRTKVLPLAQNYDMGPSIARSDSFDVQHYELFLDVTDYAGQHLDAHATIDFTVLQDGGTRVWWDLVAALGVDSLTWNGNPIGFSRWGDEMHIDAPEAMASGDTVTLNIWYSGQPGDDPYWGGI